MMNMMQIVLMRMEEMQSNMMEEIRNSRKENERNIERLEKTIRGPEGKVEKELSQVNQHCCSEREMKNKIL